MSTRWSMITRAAGLALASFSIAGRTERPRAGRVGLEIALALACLLPAAPGRAESGGQPVPARLAHDGRAAWPVVVAAEASEATRAAAAQLAAMLERISGAPFSIEAGDGARGIAVGRAGDFAFSSSDPRFAERAWRTRDHYQLRSHQDGVQVVGATDAAVGFAVWDLLYRLGYRLFFASPRWEIVPSLASPELALDAFERPDYVERDIWEAGGGLSRELGNWRRNWATRNRMNGHMGPDNMRAYHMFQSVLADRREVFDRHPEYLPLLDGKRVAHPNSIKFCLSNPGARRVVTDQAVAALERRPEHVSVSVDASDLGNWCQCEPCAAMGPVINRMVTLANETAEAVTARWPEKHVGILCYNEHDQVPTIPVHPRVAVFISTNLRFHKLPTLKLLDGWRDLTEWVGVYEYYSVFQWTLSMPAKAGGGSVDYLTRSIPEFHQHGARMMCAEAGNDWGPNGLGYYLASRLLWDVKADAEAVVRDFLEKAFGAAAPHLARFYDAIDKQHERSGTPEFYDGRLDLMREALQAAWRTEVSEAERERLADLALYTHYVRLSNARFRAKREGDAAHDATRENLVRFAHRIADRALIQFPLLRARPEAQGIELPETPEPIRRDEIEGILNKL